MELCISVYLLINITISPLEFFHKNGQQLCVQDVPIVSLSYIWENPGQNSTAAWHNLAVIYAYSVMKIISFLVLD